MIPARPAFCGLTRRRKMASIISGKKAENEAGAKRKRYGIVYVFTTPRPPNLVTIGHVNSLSIEAVKDSLRESGVKKYKLHYAMRVHDDVKRAEKIIHQLFGHAKKDGDTFDATPDQIREAMEFATMECEIAHDRGCPEINVKGYAPAKSDKSLPSKKKVKRMCATSGCGKPARINEAGEPMTHCERCAQLAADRSKDWYKKNRASVRTKRRKKG